MVKKLFFGAAVLGMLVSCMVSTRPVHAANRGETGIATSASLTWMEPQTLSKRLADIKGLGAEWIRVDFMWPSIQPRSADHYFWDEYDKVVEAAAAYKLKILAVVDYTPEWAQDPRCAAITPDPIQAQRCAPRDPEDFGTFAGAIARRYGDSTIRGWEIWNEPNMLTYLKTVNEFGQPEVDPKVYARLANNAAWQIRQYSGDANIITGGLSPQFEHNPSRGMRQSEYLARILPHLEADNFDGVGMHPYCWPVMPTRPEVYNAFYTVDNGDEDMNLRTIMVKAGWQGKQMWATEYGASTKGLRWTDIPTIFNRPDHVTETAQANMVESGIEEWSSKSFAGPIFVHSDSDEWLAGHKNEGGFGLRRDDGSQKPSYHSFKRATQEANARNPQSSSY